MKKIILLFLFFLITLNCTKNKVSNTHGIRFIKNKYDIIEIGKSNKNDIRKIIGPPSSLSKFNNRWIYIERKTNSQTIFKLGEKKISSNNVLIIEFDKNGILISKDLLTIDDMNELLIADKKTNKKFNQNNIVYDIFSTLREKINAGTRKNK